MLPESTGRWAWHKQQAKDPGGFQEPANAMEGCRDRLQVQSWSNCLDCTCFFCVMYHSWCC